MLIWLNGPFGGGKTQTAQELRRRLPGSVVCDPEEVGFGLHRMLPPALRGDFQDFPSWRQGVYEVLDHVLARHDGVVIAPMTVADPRYFAETVGRLRAAGHDVRHFALLAERDTVLDRLRDRGLGVAPILRAVGRADLLLRRERFAVDKLDYCLEQLSKPEFGEHIRTDSIPVTAVCDRIAGTIGVNLVPDTDSRIRGKLRRTAVTIGHIRR
ncbi:AAA family ATPase [Nocardia aurantia]|uniref:Tunicamycin resistance protein n=1 Tax=Nocardia aurantia TaxID=2585199 RepID=A0A7K0DP49_9NOCA|nr:AAA family ATPase [Nocardia aurantia]MQY27526.1 Tunicamycin resistance protein [Nocardia aurantia]